jgi:hypothetical protein
MSNGRDRVREFDELPTNVMQSELLKALTDRTRDNGATSRTESQSGSTDPAPDGEKTQRPYRTSPVVRRAGRAGIAVVIVGASAIAFSSHRAYRRSLAPRTAPVAAKSTMVVTETPAAFEQRPGAPLPAAITSAPTTGAEEPAATIRTGKTADAKRSLRSRSRRKKSRPSKYTVLVDN